MTKCDYYSLYDSQEDTCSEWADKLRSVYRSVINNNNNMTTSNNTINQQIFDQVAKREAMPEDVTDSTKYKIVKAEKTRQALELPTNCPHDSVSERNRCIFHLDPSEYESSGVTSNEVCEAFQSAVEQNKQDESKNFQKCFAGAKVRELNFTHQTLTSSDTRPIKLYLSEIDAIKFDDAVIDEHIIFDYGEIGNISCPNSQFRHAVSFKNTSIKGSYINFKNSSFYGELSFKNADLLFESATFREGEFREPVSFEDVNFKIDFTKFRTDPMSFNRAVFQDRVDFSKSKFEHYSYDKERELNEVSIKFRNCQFNSDSDFNRCKIGEVATSGLGRVHKKDNLEELDWNISFKNSVFNDGFEINDSNISGDLTMEYVSFEGGDCRFEELTIGGGLRFSDADFGNKNVTFNRTTVQGGEVDFTGASFGKGKVGFDGMTLKCHADFTQTSYAGREVSFDEFSAERVTFQGALFDISGGSVNFDMDIDGFVSFTQAKIFANQIDFSETSAKYDFNDGNSDTNERAMSFEGANIKGRSIDFSDMNIGNMLSYSHCNFEADDISFENITVHGSMSFRHSVVNTSEVDFSNCQVMEADFFDMSYTRFNTDKVKFIQMSINCNEKISFYNCNFRGEITFDNSQFNCSNINFVRINGEQATLDFRWISSHGVVIDMTDSILTDGEFIIGENETIYCFENANIGDIKIKSSKNKSELKLKRRLFEHFIIKNTTFDGFDFSNENIKKELKKTGWDIHTTYSNQDDTTNTALLNTISNIVSKYKRLITEGPDQDADPNELEVTYMKAKNGAKQKGDPEAVSQFFQKELTFRRLSHGYEFWDRTETNTSIYERFKEKSAHLQNWLSNTTLWLSVGYGEHPRNVVFTSVTIIMGFALLYRAINALPTASSNLDYLTYSFQGFIQLIVGISPTSSVIVRFLTAVEGFIGAFIIALFVITLTRSINR